MKYIDADKLKTEIERLKEENRKIKCQANERYCSGYDDAFYDLVPFLSTLESEKPRDLGERIGSYNIVPHIEDKIAKLQDMWREEKVSFDWDDLKDMIEDVARHFAEWGAEHLADARKTLEIKPGDEVTINGHKIVYDKDKGYVTIVKSEESVPNDLEEAAEEYLQKVKARFLRTLEHPTAKDCFKDGAKWQKEHDADLIEIAYNDGITIGMTKQKEQMMKEAVEGLFQNTPFPTICLDDCKNYDFKDGDKVRVIIVKEDKS